MIGYLKVIDDMKERLQGEYICQEIEFHFNIFDIRRVWQVNVHRCSGRPFERGGSLNRLGWTYFLIKVKL